MRGFLIVLLKEPWGHGGDGVLAKNKDRFDFHSVCLFKKVRKETYVIQNKKKR